MKLRKIIGLWLCIVLCVNQALSESLKELVDESILPIAIKILPALAIPPPVGPIILAALSVMQICSSVLGNDKGGGSTNQTINQEPVSKVDLMELRTAILNKLNTVDNHIVEESARIIRELTMAIETNGFFEELRTTVDFLQRTFDDMMDKIIDRRVTGMQKKLFIKDMIDYNSLYRNTLRMFVSKFIKPSVNELMLFKPPKLFFENILEKQKYLAFKDDDCDSDSLHNKIFKSYMFLLKVLTESYSMVVSAHLVKYQKFHNQTEEVEDLRINAVQLVQEFKKDAEALIETTKSTLDNASRVIRNCGKFEHIKGKTYEELGHIQTLPKIEFLEYIEPFYYKCNRENNFINQSHYEFANCTGYTDVIPFGSELSIVVEMEKLPSIPTKSPYSFMKILKPDGSEIECGHKREGAIMFQTFKTNEKCFTAFCTATQNNKYAISTQRVKAEPKNVITGVRFRMKNRVIYVDIQQGRYLNMLTVDPETVHWTETPESNEIVYLNSTVNELELGEFTLKNNSLIRSLQFKLGKQKKGLITLRVDGLTPPHMNNTESMRNTTMAHKITELQLVDADNPTSLDSRLKNIVSKRPVPHHRYYVKFQPSDFEKDFGQTTIPFFDIREVVSNPPAPLNGIGLYHEAVSGSGGFVAFKLITPNLNSLLDTLKYI